MSQQAHPLYLPFPVEDELKRVGGIYDKAAVVTGQNPASSAVAAKALLEVLAV